jgi:hypothetical protein
MTADVPIRHIDNLEIPQSGIWPVVGASSVVRSTGRRGVRLLPVVAGRFEIGEDPTDSSLRIDLDDSTLVATTALISPDRHGKSEWHLEGFAGGVGRHDQLTLNLSYHGVFRRGADVWAWLSGTGTIGTPAGRRGRRRSGPGEDQLVVEVLFAEPRRSRSGAAF